MTVWGPDQPCQPQHPHIPPASGWESRIFTRNTNRLSYFLQGVLAGGGGGAGGQGGRGAAGSGRGEPGGGGGDVCVIDGRGWVHRGGAKTKEGLVLLHG